VRDREIEREMRASATLWTMTESERSATTASDGFVSGADVWCG
jgi:hypothetical protein